MKYTLDAQNGRIKYIMQQKSGPVGSDTQLTSAEWMLRQGKPRVSDKYDGYPIAVTCNGSDYYFPGEWHDELQNVKNAQKPAKKPQKRRTKDRVCE